jgi:hypothetical protein
MTKVFRPQHFSGKYKLKVKAIGLWHWHTRRHFDSFIYRTAGRLHYLGYHAPLPIQKKVAQSCTEISTEISKNYLTLPK